MKKPNFYEPDLNPTYAELARHYGAAVIPARVRKPRDKAKVEQGVLLAERWVLAALRNRTLFSLEEARVAVKELVEKLNNRPMKKLKRSRRELFEEMERAALKPLPARAYEFASWARPRVHVDYHVEFDGHFYSVRYQLVGQQGDLRATERTIEIFRGGRRETSHLRSWEKGKHTTKVEHMPKAAPGAGRVDAGAAGGVGKEDGAGDGGARRGNHEAAPHFAISAWHARKMFSRSRARYCSAA